MYIVDGDDARAVACASSPATPTPTATRRAAPLRVRRRPGRPVRGAARSCILLDDVPPDAVHDRSRACSNAVPRNVIVLPVLFEGPGQGGHRTGLAVRVHRHRSVAFLEQLTGSHRRRAQHHRGDDAHRGPARSSRSSSPANCRRSRTSCSRPTRSSRRRRALLAEQNAEVERKNQRNRAGAPRARGEGRRARAHLALQVRVPREHVARAAHAAQQHPDPRPAAGGERRTATSATAQVEFAKTIHARRHRPAEPDQRHPRPVEDRVGHGHGRQRGDRVHAPAREHRAQLPPRGRSAARSTFSVDFDSDARPRASTPTPSACMQILKNLLSNALQVHRAGQRAPARRAWRKRGWSAGSPGARRRRRRWSRSTVTDTGIGISPEKQKHHLRGVPAGRRRHLAQVRRHRPGPRDQPRARAACSAANCACISAPGKGSTFTLYLPLDYVGAGRTASSRGASAQRRRTPVTSRRALRSALEEVPDDRDRLDARRARRCWSSRTIRTTRRCCATSRASRGFKVLVANRGAEALRLVREYKPSAISLDIFLPDMLGWTVLARLKQDSDDAPHPGADRHRRGRAPPQHRARRVLVPRQAGDDRDASTHALERIKRIHAAAHEARCWSSRTMPASA